MVMQMATAVRGILVRAAMSLALARLMEIMLKVGTGRREVSAVKRMVII